MEGTVTITCSSCGTERTIAKCCPYTGMRHGQGWCYRCETCGGETYEKEKQQ